MFSPEEVGIIYGMVLSVPGTAANRSEAAAERAETAADSITPATVAETKTFLGIV